LRLQVTRAGTKRWFLRATAHGKTRDYALELADNVSLAEARERAAAIRKAIADGKNPALVPIASGRLRRGAMTFAAAWERFWAVKGPTLSGEKDRQTYSNMIVRNVLPFIGERPVAVVETGEVVEMLRPIWTTKEETARKVFKRTKKSSRLQLPMAGGSKPIHARVWRRCSASGRNPLSIIVH